MRWRPRALGACGTAALVLAGCNQAGNSADDKTAFDKSFSAAFDKSTHDSCVVSATARGAPGDAAQRYCACVVAALDKLTADQKEKLDPSSPQLQSAATTCRPQIQTPSS